MIILSTNISKIFAYAAPISWGAKLKEIICDKSWKHTLISDAI